MIGKRILHYEISRELGRGGMGKVYEATDARLGRRVAVKVLPEHSVRDQSAVERFKREAQMASALNHPNIVTIHDIVDAGEQQCIVMELIEGRTLRELMGERPSLEKSLAVIQQVAEALSVAHEAGIIHRDLKPENIMVRGDGYAKVLDFGLARLGASLDSRAETMMATGPGVIVGTVPYMSPEQCSGRPLQSASDIFSLGVVLYETATGRHPFSAESKVACISRITSEQPVSPSKLDPAVPAALEALITRMLEKNPLDRPTAEDVSKGLTTGQDAGTLEAQEAAAAGRPSAIVVGRSTQEAAMREVYETAAAGAGRLLCVTGEPGMGKTTLVDDFLRKLAAEKGSCLVARGRCSERLAGAEAYLPLLEVLDNLLRGGSGGQVAETLKLLAPTWYFRVAPLSTEDSSTSRLLEDARAASQERMKRELFSFLEELSRVTPVVLFFDDLHWADVSTVDFLGYLGVRADGLRLLTVATYRPSDLLLAEHPFVGVKRELQARGVCHEVALSFLSREDVSRYLDIEYAGHAFTDGLADFVHVRTEGNPLFLVNLLRYLEGEGSLVETDRWRLVKPMTEIEKEMPESVRSMIDRKIDQLEDANRRLLMAASVQGAEFHAAVVAEVLEADEAEVEESLERLDRVHAFVRRMGEEEMPDGSLTLRYAFVHALYQNALYDTLTPARRAKLSTAVAEALQRRHGEDLDAIAGELGMLFEAARDFARAADSFLMAADKAARVYANHEAVELCGRSIANARKLRGDDREARVMTAALHLAQLQITLSRFKEAEESFALAEGAAEAADLTEEHIRAICGRGMSVYNLKQIDEMQAQGERAMELARSIDSEVGIASAELVLATRQLCVGELEVAQEIFARAVPVLQKSGLQVQALEGVVYSGALHGWLQEYDQAHHMLGVALERGRELGSGYAIVGAQFFRGLALGNQGRLGEALECLTEARRLAELNREQYWLPRLPNTVGWLHRELGDTEGAHLLNLENVELAKEFMMPEGEANAHVNLAGDYLSLGDPDRAYEHLQKADAIFRQDVWYRWRYSIRLQSEYARYWIKRGDLVKARKHSEASEKAARAHQARKHIAGARGLLGEIALLEDNMDDAGVHFDEAIAVVVRYPCPTLEWKILVQRADLARKLGDVAAADAWLGRARETIRRLADSVHDDKLRTIFLRSRPVREL
jgi:tetratricopeptide (TPR) repeat protein/predicted Ser/Thr protein kinase